MLHSGKSYIIKCVYGSGWMSRVVNMADNELIAFNLYCFSSYYLLYFTIFVTIIHNIFSMTHFLQFIQYSNFSIFLSLTSNKFYANLIIHPKYLTNWISWLEFFVINKSAPSSTKYVVYKKNISCYRFSWNKGS